MPRIDVYSRHVLWNSKIHMTEFSVEFTAPGSDFEAAPESRIYFRDDPESLIEPVIDDLVEVLGDNGYWIEDRANNTGVIYFVDCPAAAAPEVQSCIQEYGFWVTMVPLREIEIPSDPSIQL
jgi:hypothetical protein